jgi:hypothetical protein
MIRKDFKKSLQKIVKKYFKGVYSKSVNVLTSLSDIFEDEKLNYKQQKQFEKFMLIFFLGHTVDLPTLNSILLEYDLKSNNQSRQFNWSVYITSWLAILTID